MHQKLAILFVFSLPSLLSVFLYPTPMHGYCPICIKAFCPPFSLKEGLFLSLFFLFHVFFVAFLLCPRRIRNVVTFSPPLDSIFQGNLHFKARMHENVLHGWNDRIVKTLFLRSFYFSPSLSRLQPDSQRADLSDDRALRIIIPCCCCFSYLDRSILSLHGYACPPA